MDYLSLEALVEKPISGEWGTGDGVINVIRSANFTNHGRISFDKIVARNIPDNKVKTKKLQEDDIIIEKSGGSPTQPVGRVVFFDQKGTYLCSNFTSILRPRKQYVAPKYLHYILFCNHKYGYVEKYQNKTTGIINLQLQEYLKNTKIPLPPLPEQQKIASILDAADNLRQKDQQLIEKYTALSQSLFLEMFGDPVSNPMGWDKRNLQDLVKSVIDCPHTTPNWTSSGKVAIRTSNLTQGGWSWKDKRFVSEEDFHDRSKRGYVKHGDIILSREGTVGVLAIVEMEMEICLGQRLVQLIPDFSLANNYYLLHLLLYELEPERISRIMVGATSKHLNVKELREMSLPVPPIDLQNQFAERIQSIEAQKQLALASLEKSEALFNTLLQRAFKGELTT